MTTSTTATGGRRTAASNGKPETYDPGGGGSRGTRDRQHPSMAIDGSLSPAGHRQYCAKNIADAIEGAGGIATQSAVMQRGVKYNPKLSPDQKKLIMRRNKRADRRVIAAYRALAKAWLNKQKVREKV